MRKRKSYRPTVNDRLEDRTVPAFLGGLGGNLIASVPTKDAVAVGEAFGAFGRAYYNDVQTILFAKGTTNPSADPTVRAKFDAQVATDLDALNSAIDKAIANLPDAATLDATIKAELLDAAAATPGAATTPATLQTQLDALKTPTRANLRTETNFLYQALTAVGQTGAQVVHQVRNAAPPANSITQSTVQTLLGAIDSAYQTFTQGYFNAVKATPPSTARPAFDTAVSGLLTTLNGNISAAVTAAKLPSAVAASLTSTLAGDLLTPAAAPPPGASPGLQTRLSRLQTPASATGFPAWVFNAYSLLDIKGSQFQVSRDVISAIGAYNNKL